MALRRLKIATWIALLGLVLSLSAFGVSILNYVTANRQYAASNTLNMLDKRLNPEVLRSMTVVATCLRKARSCDSETDKQQAFFLFFGYLESVAQCIELDLCSREIATSVLSAEIAAARQLKSWVLETRRSFRDPDYLVVTERVFLTG